MKTGSDVIFKTHDGSHSILSEKYGVSYHSKYGAIQETQHVFIDHGLKSIAAKRDHISILEFGFGTGLNAFMTYLWLKEQGKSGYYETIEAFPIALEHANSLNFVSLLEAEDSEGIFQSMHSSLSSELLSLSPSFQFKKVVSLFEDVDYPSTFDLVYFDAFAPSAQPDLWEENILSKVYRSMNPGGLMTTYCAKGSVKRTLKSLGFKVTSPPGPPGKREMTLAFKLPE